jgi:hypothetical protein
VAKKVAGLAALLNAEEVDIRQLKERLSEGIPDEAGVLREYSWKLVLGYLPARKSEWQASIERQEKTYHSLVRHFLPAEKF